jgi:hypothetical protein
LQTLGKRGSDHGTRLTLRLESGQDTWGRIRARGRLGRGADSGDRRIDTPIAYRFADSTNPVRFMSLPLEREAIKQLTEDLEVIIAGHLAWFRQLNRSLLYGSHGPASQY